MKVIIINRLGIGGAERLVVDEVNELFRRNIPVKLVTLKREKKDSYIGFCRIPERDRICIPFKTLYDIRAWRMLIAFLRDQKPEVVFTHLWFSNLIGRVAAWIAGCPRVISFEHNVYDVVKTRKQFLVDFLLQYLSARIVAVSDSVRSSLIARGISTHRIVLVYNGIDLSRYAEATPSTIRADLSLEDSFVFLYAGRLIHQKGVDLLIEAFAHVEGAYLLIAGTGIDKAVLETKVRDLHLESRVFFLGVRNDVPKLMKSADCIVVPSRWEGIGIVLLEAMACGTPLIVSEFGAAGEAVKAGESALMVPLGNTEALADSMNWIRSDSLLQRKLSDGGIKAVQQFSIQKHIDTILHI